MTASLHTLQPRNHRRSRVLDMHGATVFAFPKKTRAPDSYAPRLNYMDAWVELNCQAALALASIVGLQLRAVGVLHRSHTLEHEAASCRTDTPPEEFAGASARKLQPDEPA